jgi:hypothetical protein
MRAFLKWSGVALFVIAVLFAHSLYPKKASVEEAPQEPTYAIPYETAWNYRQSVNACGPYSVAAVMRALGDSAVTSEDLATTLWRPYRGYTLPTTMVSALQERGFTVDQRLVPMSDAEKVRWLRSKLEQGSPVIILIRQGGVLHYVTLLGYAEQAFYVYDSLQSRGEGDLTVDANGDLSGNVTWTDEELLAQWNAGGLFGLYRSYAMVVEK